MINQKTKEILVLIVIFVLGAFLRFYHLGQSPPSLNWDEASLGYDSYSLLKTGRDQYGKFLPLAFRSFDDYKPPVYVYLTVPSLILFGLNAQAVRFPSALLGTLTILIVYLITKKMFQDHPKAGVISLISSWLLWRFPLGTWLSPARHSKPMSVCSSSFREFFFCSTPAKRKAVFSWPLSFLF